MTAVSDLPRAELPLAAWWGDESAWFALQGPRCPPWLPPLPFDALGYPPLPCHDAARASRASLAVQRERAAIADDMARLSVEAGAVGRDLKAGARERESALVEADLLRLEVQRLRSLLGRWGCRGEQ